MISLYSFWCAYLFISSLELNSFFVASWCISSVFNRATHCSESIMIPVFFRLTLRSLIELSWFNEPHSWITPKLVILNLTKHLCMGVNSIFKSCHGLIHFFLFLQCLHFFSHFRTRLSFESKSLYSVGVYLVATWSTSNIGFIINVSLHTGIFPVFTIVFINVFGPL